MIQIEVQIRRSIALMVLLSSLVGVEITFAVSTEPIGTVRDELFQKIEKTAPQSQQDILDKFYNAEPDQVSIVDVPEMKFLMIDGEGDPNTSKDFSDAVSALYSVSFTLKFMLMKEYPAETYTVMPLEGQWWTKDSAKFDFVDKSNLQWTLMMMQPEFVTAEMIEKAIVQAGKNRPLPALEKLRFETFNQGRSAQILHVGPYSEEGPTIQKLHGYIAQSGFRMRGKHHEIYLGNPQTTKPEDLKTILRQPIE